MVAHAVALMLALAGMATPAPAAGRLLHNERPANALRRMAVASSAVYLITAPWHPYPGSAIVKGLSIVLLALIAFRAQAVLLSAALALSAVGDVLLDIDPRNLFVFGLGSFLLAHLAYTVLFVRSRTRPVMVFSHQAGLILAVLIYTTAFAAWLIPSLGGLAFPVVMYMCAIIAMVLSAILARFTSGWLIAGAILFLISDSILAVDKFKTPVPLRDYLVWITYYAGQYGIAIGYLRENTYRVTINYC